MNEKKYKVQALLEGLPFNEVAKAKAFLVRKFGITERTFLKYQTTTQGEHYQIPGDHLVQMASFFGVTVAEMYVKAPGSLHLEWLQEKNKQTHLDNV